MQYLCVVVIIATIFVAACASSMQETRFDPATRTTQVTTYSPYFETRTILVKDRIGLDLVVDLEKKRIPGLYQLQQSLGALGPGDLDASGLFTAYLHNMTTESLVLEISSMAHLKQPIPGIPARFELKPDTYAKVELGRVGIFAYAKDLKVEVYYIFSGQLESRTLVLRRLTPAEIESSVAHWKGKKKNVPSFFPD